MSLNSFDITARKPSDIAQISVEQTLQRTQTDLKFITKAAT